METPEFEDEDCKRSHLIYYPQVYIYHYDGGYMKRTNVKPSLERDVSKPSRFTIIPLDADGRPKQLQTKIQTRSEYFTMLVEISKNGDKVAIQDETDSFISCRRDYGLTKSRALAEYRANIGEYEMFEVEYIIERGTFSFKSHNNLYLHYNKYCDYLAFNSSNKNNANWSLLPLGVTNFLDSDETIIYVGAIDIGKSKKDFLFKRVTEGVNPNWNTDFEILLEQIQKHIDGGNSTIFQHPITKHQWYVTKNEEDCITLVITSEKFPKGLAIECHDGLNLILENYNSIDRDKELEQRGVDKDKIVGKEVAALMIDYEEIYYTSTEKKSKATEMEQEIQRILSKMGENIACIQNNIENADLLLEKSDELREQAKLFKKQTSKLPKSFWKKRGKMIMATLFGAGGGAAVGLVIGGPGGAAILATESAEIAVGAVAGGSILGAAAVACPKITFWDQKFVSFTPPA
jgi:hypothetical protein